MDTIVFAAVILAALLHASWNAMVRGQGDKVVGMTSVILGEGLFAVPGLVWAPFPDPASWPCIAASVALHTGYGLVLIAAYRLGELTLVYPIARGAAPLIVAASSAAIIGEALPAGASLAILILCSGIISLGLVRSADGTFDVKAVLVALLVGCFIAAYSICDGIGARLSGNAVGYWSWIAAIDVVVFLAIAYAWRGRRLPGAILANWRVTLVGGFACYVAYALITWAFVHAPVAVVTALRETSIVFALLIGVLLLKERLSLMKCVATFATVAGAVLLRIGR
jgi:drug/metabolite transporter (DMT)-like permease